MAGFSPSPPRYGSDVIVDLLKSLRIPYVTLNPGATFRGLHDSLVNYGGNQAPEIIQVCHEEIGVAIAHGYAKATGAPLATITHNLVGLQHASMAIFNAWCDRAPVLVLGGTGPMDTSRRRPWIDWVHTALVQGNQVRDYVKWDDQPATLAAVPSSVYRAHRLSVSEPQGPVYVCFDADIQEEELAEPVSVPAPDRYSTPGRIGADPEAIGRVADWLVEANQPVLIAGLAGRDLRMPPILAELSTLLAAPVIDTGDRFNIANTHPLDLTDARPEVLSQADLVVALDVPDLFGTLRSRWTARKRVTDSLLPDHAKVVHITVAELMVRSLAGNYHELPAVDLSIPADTALALPALLAAVKERLAAGGGDSTVREQHRERWTVRHQEVRASFREIAAKREAETPVALTRLVTETWEVARQSKWILANGDARGWVRKLWDCEQPGCHLGGSEGAGLGYGPGAALGAALAYKDDPETLVINLQGEGEFLFTPSALWTAAHHRLPLLTVIVNNRSYYNDEVHQRVIAEVRGRSVEDSRIGTVLEDPVVDFAGLARSFGIFAEGPIERSEDLGPALRRAAEVVRKERRPALVDVIVSKD